MLTIGKIGGRGGGQWRSPDYYTQQVARGAEDYYSGRGEAPGEWTGDGAAALGLTGVVEDGQLQALFDRQHPIGGDQLAREPGEFAVRGIDLQVAVPKSVSTLWALADEYGVPEVSGKVWDATHGAGRAALDYLERHACTSRAGKGGHIRLKGEGFVGAAFPHRFSREGDPQVHVHFLVANMTLCGDPDQGVDRAWRTLDARDLYAHRMAAGYVFQAELRERLTRDLGVQWTDVHKGTAEVVGVPRTLTEALSQRRAQILQQLGRDGRAGTAREAELAALTTRKAKESFDLPEQRKHWRALAEEHLYGPAELRASLGRSEARPLNRGELAALVDDLTGGTGLTGERSAFARRDVVQQLAGAHGRGASVERIEELADSLIASDQIVALDGPTAGPRIRAAARRGATRREATLTTADMLAVEAAMVDSAIGRVGDGVAVVPLGAGNEWARRPSGLMLSDEQQAVVRKMVTSGDGVELVRSRAGTGKTTMLDAARELWEQTGVRVIGAALAGRAADELQARAAIESYTVHGLLHDLDRGAEWSLAPGSVLVIDEAGMVDTRRMARVLQHAAEARVKVVVIGDDRQLPAVEAGGAFAALADRLGASELTEVFRQRHAWDRAALDELRHGDVAKWIDAYDRHGRLVPCTTADAQLQAVVCDWWVAAQEHGMVETAMFAATLEDTHDLNALARAARVAGGELDDTTALVAAGRTFTEGDRVLALRNRWLPRADSDSKHQLRNGNRGTVTAIDRDRGELTVTLDSGVPVVLANDYLADGYLSHGYAQTIHKSQGMTVTRDFVLGAPTFARELGYVGSSRHTEESRFYVNVGDRDLDRPQLPGLEDEPLYGELERALGQERAKQLAVDATEIDTDLGRLTTAELIEITDRGRDVLTSIPRQARRAKDAALVERAAVKIEATETRLAEARAELADLKRFDRQRRTEIEQRIWGLESSLETAREELAEQLDRAAGQDPDEWIARHEMQLVDAAAAERELAARRADAHWRARRTAALDADPAIERELGERPAVPTDRERWEQAVAAQESYRLQYGTLPHEHDLPSLTGRQAADWQEAHRLVQTLFDPAKSLTRARDDTRPDLSSPPAPDLSR